MCKKLIYLVSVVAVLFLAAPAGALLVDWENAVAPASPGFLATNVEDGLYDIGAYGGEMTYEFVVKSNPDETEASMCLIGRRQFGDTQAGLKYEQWNNTGTYGATLFGVVDLDFGIPTSPGMDTHLTFVSSETSGTTALYVNGVYQASVDAAVTLSGLVGIGYGAQGADGSEFFDDFDGVIYGVAIYDAALSDEEIAGHSDAFFRPEPADPGSEGLVAYYAMENNTDDSSGNELHGTIVGATNYVEGPADYGMAMEFDGASYVDCGNDAKLDILGPISLALWIRPDANDPEGQGTETAPMAKAMSGMSPSWSYQVRYGWNSPQPYMAFTFNTSPRAWVYVGQNLERNEWCHIACSHDGTTLTCYLNGVETDSTPMGQITSSQTPVLIGSDGWSCDWIGAIDEVAIYDRDLSGGEVRYLAGDRPPPVVLFEEDFEGLPLGPNIDEALAGEAVWTDIPPEGWAIDESGIPGIGDPTTDGVTEWAGWAFANKDWWIETAGDQDRSLFTLGIGTVAIADPDEWDDADRVATPIADDPYDTWLSTPAIDISGVGAGTLQLTFDSSWRPEFDSNYHQTANVTASFDGADPVEVLLWESDEASPNYKPYATNETVIVDLGNPEGATSVVLTFGLFDAGNDWWWAIDNVEVISPVQ